VPVEVTLDMLRSVNLTIEESSTFFPHDGGKVTHKTDRATVQPVHASMIYQSMLNASPLRPNEEPEVSG
jgi:hypothetical protein